MGAAPSIAEPPRLTDLDRAMLAQLPADWSLSGALGFAAGRLPTAELPADLDVAMTVQLAGIFRDLERRGLAEIEFRAGDYYLRRSSIGEQLLACSGEA